MNKTADEQIAELEAKAIAELSGEKPKEEDKPDETPAPVAAADDKSEKPGEAETPKPEEPKEPKPEEKPAEDSKPTKPEDEAVADAEDEEIDLSKLKAKGQERIRDLAKAAKQVPQLEREIQRLQTLMGLKPAKPSDPVNPGRPNGTKPAAAPQTPKSPNQFYPEWLPGNDNKDDSKEMTEEELRAQAREEARIEYRNQKMIDTLDYDIATVKDTYPELREPTKENPNPDYDEKLVDFLGSTFEAAWAKDNSLRFVDFVKTIMSLKGKGAEEGRRQADKVLKKQSAEQAIVSDGTPPDKRDNLETKIKGARTSADLAELEKLLPHADN